MKISIEVIAFIIEVCTTFVGVLPTLVSAKSDIALLASTMVIIGQILFTIWLIKYWVLKGYKIFYKGTKDEEK